MRIPTWFSVATAATLACGAAVAQPQARVLSVIPVAQQVAVPQPICQDEQVYAGPDTQGTGAVIGAVIGGLAGNALGQGSRRGPHGYYRPSSRGPSTVVGAIAGGVIGHSVESANSQPRYQTVRRCTHGTAYETQTVAYDVTYEYAGQRYTTRLDYDPGDWLPVTVQPQGSYSSSPAYTPFVGRNGVYQSAPPGVVVTENFSAPQPPVVVDLHLGYPLPPAYARPPRPPAPPYWR